MELSNCLNAFLFDKKICGLSKKSLSDYQQFLLPFIKFVNRPLSELSIYDVNAYFCTLLERKVSRSTYATYVRNVKIFLRWCESHYDFNINAKSIKIPKSPKKNPYIYSDDEIKAIFSTIYSDDWLSVRNCCIVSLMLDSGLRQSECSSLRWDNVYMESNYINVFGKGDKERIVPLGTMSKRFLEEYSKKCPFLSKTVFVNRCGDDITNNAIKLFVSKYAKIFPFEFSSHKLRHNFATNFLIDSYYKKGFMDVYALMSILGHESLETTNRYLHIANQVVYSKAHISHLDNIYLGGEFI